jgi:ankyrin repeat protein
MSPSNRSGARKRLPVNPSIENLKKQAKRLAKSQPALSLQQAQHRLAIDYGCTNWDELSHVVETMGRGATLATTGKGQMEPLPAAANRNDLDAVREILRDGPFTQHDLDLALARAVLRFSERRAIAELLVEHGADPDGQYGANYGPIVFVTGECLDPDGLQFLIDDGADVTFPHVATKYGDATPLSYTLGTYLRGHNDRKHRCIEILLRNGAIVPPEINDAMLAIHRGDARALRASLDRDPALVPRNFAEMPFGNIDLRGATLTHLAVEFGEIECLEVLLDRGADINQAADTIGGVGGQTPIYHAIGTNHNAGISVLERLVQRGDRRVDPAIRATFRLDGEIQGVPITPLEYAERAVTSEDAELRRAGEREVSLLKSLSRGGG